ncbi:MAG TPA: phytanoyl-CoA dioxygenase family protein [Polyangiaceae bacterium]|jgi:ectoine hydroxylase-related dioxygenase (phytanoyl-CoA dioxygenase family)
MKTLSGAQLDFYREQGYLVIQPFLSDSEVGRLKSAILRVASERADSTIDHGGFNLERARDAEGDISSGVPIQPGLLRKIQEVTECVPEVAEFCASDRALDLVEDLIGPDIYYHSSKVMFKPASHGSAKPWHQDHGYWSDTKPEQVTLWLALDDASPENGCVRLIPGSHRWGPIRHYKKELQVDEEGLPKAPMLVAAMRAGSLLAFHALTLHSSLPNRSDRSRWALLLTYDPNPRGAAQGFAGDRALRLRRTG